MAREIRASSRDARRIRRTKFLYSQYKARHLGCGLHLEMPIRAYAYALGTGFIALLLY